MTEKPADALGGHSAGVTLHMTASLDGVVALVDGSIDQTEVAEVRYSTAGTQTAPLMCRISPSSFSR